MRDDPAPPGRELLSGVVERVTFHSEETGFAVLRVKVKGRREPVTVVGYAASAAPGEEIQASGSWTVDPRHGPQFRATHLTAVAPTTIEGIESYLGSGAVRGVGPELARRLVAAFGAAVLEVVETGPDRLRTVQGIGPVRAARIAASWAEQRAVREIMLFLHAHGVGTSRAVRIHRTYGSDAIAVVKGDPYRLARDVRGIGFKTADAIASRLGFGKTAAPRVRAGISHALAEAMDDGHCGLPREELVTLAAGLLEVPAPLVTEALALEVASGSVVEAEARGRLSVFLAGLFRSERRLAEKLLALARGRPPWSAFDAETALAGAEERLGVTLAPLQREAVRLALASKVLVLTGGPGVGKTTLVSAVLRVLLARGVRPVLCAPTGRAAKRLTESTGLLAKTIHRLLEVDPGTGLFRRGEGNPLDGDLFVVDETSMIDVPLARALLDALPTRAAMLLVGDADQLPSVGPGDVLRDVLESKAVPAVRLTHIFRQAAESRIVVAAHRVNAGLMPELTAPEGSDFYFVEEGDPEAVVRLVVRLVKERIPLRFGLDPVRDVQVLCPMNRGGLGARALNAALQAALNPPGPVKVERLGSTFSPGDKVMQVENDYGRDVYNGDLGIVTAVDLAEAELRVSFDGRDVSYGLDDLDSLVLAYAATVHKAQGSEYPAVVLPLTMQHYPMLRRNLLYTALTRGRRLVVVVGEKRALALAVRRDDSGRRTTKLADWLREGRERLRDAADA